MSLKVKKDVVKQCVRFFHSFFKVYNMNTVSKELELPGAFIIGAGAASSKTVGMNAEVS